MLGVETGHDRWSLRAQRVEHRYESAPGHHTRHVRLLPATFVVQTDKKKSRVLVVPGEELRRLQAALPGQAGRRGSARRDGAPGIHGHNQSPSERGRLGVEGWEVRGSSRRGSSQEQVEAWKLSGGLEAMTFWGLVLPHVVKLRDRDHSPVGSETARLQLHIRQIISIGIASGLAFPVEIQPIFRRFSYISGTFFCSKTGQWTTGGAASGPHLHAVLPPCWLSKEPTH